MKKVDENTPIGTKVVPIDKTAGMSLKNSHWASNGYKQGFLYYVGHVNEDNFAICNSVKSSDSGDFFNYSDLVLYEENQTEIPIQLPHAIQDRIKELEDEVKRLKEKYEPYDIGELYAFADDEDDFKENNYSVGKLTDYDGSHAPFECNDNEWYKYVRKIKPIELC